MTGTKGDPPSTLNQLHDRILAILPYLTGADEPLRQLLEPVMLQPEEVHRVNLRIRDDEGEFITATGWRVVHSRALGTPRGGTRIHWTVTEEELTKLATEQTIKNSAAGLKSGGAKGGIAFDPASLDRYGVEEKQHLMELLVAQYVYKLHGLIGDGRDILGPDMNATPEIMGLMSEVYTAFARVTETEGRMAFTGKPDSMGGIQAVRKPATGLGLAHAALLSAEHYNLPTATALVEGWGNVASFGCQYLAQEAGTKVLGVRDMGPNRTIIALFNGDGINLEDLNAYRAAHGTVAGFEGAESISPEDFWGIEADIAIPAATAHTIGEREAEQLNVTLVAEGANDPLQTAADRILGEKTVRGQRVRIVPDVLANAGGVIVSAYETAINGGERIAPQRIVNRVKFRIGQSLGDSWVLQDTRDIPTLREAAYVYGITRVLTADRSGL